MTRRCILSTTLILASVFGCKSAPPTFEEPPPAEELYETGLKQLEGRRIWGVLPFVNHGKAIETFQSIVDNYPYSDYAVLAELKIADGYFADHKYEEALSYYRDFSDLHPQHPKSRTRSGDRHSATSSARRGRTATRRLCARR